MSDTMTNGQRRRLLLTNLSARVLGRMLRDSRITPIAIEYYAMGAFEELLRQLPEPSDLSEAERQLLKSTDPAQEE